jgi:outer membrane lipoprotein SlyB
MERLAIRFYVILVIPLLVLTCCSPQGQSRYNYDEVGQISVVEFGTIISARQVDITGKNTGTGAVLGGTAGGLVGSAIGKGGGNAAAIVGGLVIGAVAGAVAEQAMANHVGLEYTILLRNGKVITLVQDQEKKDRVFQPNERVMVQVSGSYERVLPADQVPTEMDRPKGITVRGD